MDRLVVLDAPCIVELLFNGHRALEVLEAIYRRSLAAPSHVDIDVVSTLALVTASGVAADDTRRRVEVYLRMPIKRHDVSTLMLDAWDRQRDPCVDDVLRVNEALCVNDVLYVALAEYLEVPLVTRNRAMAAACSRAILVEATLGWGSMQRLEG